MLIIPPTLRRFGYTVLGFFKKKIYTDHYRMYKRICHIIYKQKSYIPHPKKFTDILYHRNKAKSKLDHVVSLKKRLTIKGN